MVTTPRESQKGLTTCDTNGLALDGKWKVIHTRVEQEVEEDIRGQLPPYGRGWLVLQRRETLIIKHQDVLISFNLSTCSTTIQPPSPTPPPALLLLPFSDDSGDNRERIPYKWTNIWNVFTHRKSHTFYQGFTSTVLLVVLVLFVPFLPELSDDSK